MSVSAQMKVGTLMDACQAVRRRKRQVAEELVTMPENLMEEALQNSIITFQEASEKTVDIFEFF